jgi:hypothetical protein
MVKNYGGGNKAKGFANKHSSKKSTELRTSKDELELYAQVESMSGGTICRVKTLDGTEMICHIRGKFRGRGKRDNFIGKGTWMLVGLREWENIETKTEDKNAVLNCDVIEVYNDADKKSLKNTITNINWAPFNKNDSSAVGDEDNSSDEELGFAFADEKTSEFQDIINAHIIASKSGTSNIIVTDDGAEEVNADDI